jgi:hypothetical protein
MALSVLAVHVQPTLKGEKNKSWVCSVTNHGIPVPENWRLYFIGYYSELKDRILAEFDAWEKFGKADLETQSQTPHSEELNDDSDALEAGYDDF